MKKILALLLFLAFAGSAHTQTYWPPEGSGGEGVDVCVGQTQDVGDVFTSSGGADSCYNLQAPPGAGGGEANTASNLGGGVGITNTKVGIDLPFDTFSSNQFSAASNVISLNIVADYVGTGSWDLGGGSFEIPNGASLPGTCNIGQMYHWTGTTSGQRTFVCESANTWVLQGDGGAGGGGTPDDDSVTPAKMADGDFGDWSVATNVATLDADTVGLAELAACTGPNEIVEYGASGVPACIATPGGGGGSQTPWASNIDGAGFDLTGVGALAVGDTISGSYDMPVGKAIFSILDDTSGDGWFCESNVANGAQIDCGYTIDGTTMRTGVIYTSNTMRFTRAGGFEVFGLVGAGSTVRESDFIGWSNSTNAVNVFEAGFFYDGTDTVNLGTASGTADANLEVLGLTVGDTISGSWDLPSGENLLLLTDDTSDDGYQVKSAGADGSAVNIGLTQDGGTTFAQNIQFWAGGVIVETGSLNQTYFTQDVSVRNVGQFKFSANNDATGAADIGMCRESAGTLMVSDGAGCVAGTDEADLAVDEIQLTDQGTKGTCDSAKAGTIAYEVVTNVGTFHGCQQTGVGTFAWVALH